MGRSYEEHRALLLRNFLQTAMSVPNGKQEPTHTDTVSRAAAAQPVGANTTEGSCPSSLHSIVPKPQVLFRVRVGAQFGWRVWMFFGFWPEHPSRKESTVHFQTCFVVSVPVA